MKKFMTLLMLVCMCISLCACGGNDRGDNQEVTSDNAAATTEQTNADVKVADLEAAVAEALGENYFPTADMETLEDLEITSDMYEEFVYKIPMISTNVDTLIIVKAASGQTANVEAKLNQFRDNNINNLMQYPMNLTKIQCSQVVTIGDYVIFVQLGGGLGMEAVQAAIEKNENLTEDESVKIEMDVINEQNNMAIDVIRKMVEN